MSHDTSSQVVQLQQIVVALPATVSELAQVVGALRCGSWTRSRTLRADPRRAFLVAGAATGSTWSSNRDNLRPA